ncbi:hypothetical protein D3C81_1130410 [compost metagenome]
MPLRCLSSDSNFNACAWVAVSDVPSASSISTISSGRVESGKNCCGTKRNITSENTNKPMVAKITSQRRRRQASRNFRKR